MLNARYASIQRVTFIMQIVFRNIQHQGFTLVELVMTIVIMGVAAVGITAALSFGLRHQSDGISYARSVALAQAYMEDILSKRYDENTPLGGVPACSPTTTACSSSANFNDGESRAQFDDVDDFHGVDDSPPLNVDGGNRDAFARYRVQVNVAYANPTQITGFGLTHATDAKIVTVTVTSPGTNPLTFRAVRTNF